MVSPQALGSDIEYPLWSNALSEKSILSGRVALTPNGLLFPRLSGLHLWKVNPSIGVPLLP